MDDTQLFLIHGDDYLSHISDKAAIYSLLLTMGRETREKLCDGDVKGAVRQLSQYEQEARRAFAEWNIPESYLQSGDVRELRGLIEDELFPADDVTADYKTVDALLDMANSLAGSASEITRVSHILLNGANTLMSDLENCRGE